MTIYYLYIKTHNTTGLKYLGQTSKQNPYTYCGSGKDWVKHLNEHGYNVHTEILRECNSKKRIKLFRKILFNLLQNIDRS